MKKFLFLIACISFGISHAQNQPIDTTRYDYIGKKIDSTIYNGDGSYLNDLFDKDYMFNKVARKSDEEFVKEFNSGFKRGLSQSFDLGDKIAADIGEYGYYDFIRSRVNKKGEYHLLFRLYSSDEGLNYHDYKLRDINGEVKIVDVYIFTTGEYLSKTFSNLYDATISQKPNLVDKFLKKTLVDDLLKVSDIRSYMNVGNYEQAYKVFNSLSSEGKKQKMFKLMGVLISGQLDEETYAKEIREFEALFPNDPSLYLVSIDGYILAEKYNRALMQTNLLDRAVGGDSFLNYLRSNIYYVKEDFTNSIKSIESFMKDYPHVFDGYDVALTLYIEGGKPKKAIDILNTMLDFFEYDKAELKQSIEQNFPTFVSNPEYIQWSKK